MEYSHLCIGGPYDGLGYTSLTPSFSVNVVENQQMLDFDSAAAAEPVAIKTMLYVRQPLPGIGETIYVWVPDGQPYQKTLALLLESYKEHGLRKKR